jgi:hypothetical protein
MNKSKFFTGGIIGGILSFVLSWLIWGVLLKSFMEDHSNTASGVFRGTDEIIWWALITGNLAAGFLLSYVVSKSGATGFNSGAVAGAITGLLLIVTADCLIYAQVKLWDSSVILYDAVAGTMLGAIVGGIIGAFYEYGKKQNIIT